MSSQNIFTDIGKAIFKKKNDSLSVKEEHADKLKAFLSKPNKEMATNLFTFIKIINQKESIFNLMNDLRKYEDSVSEILPDHRDHFVHSASVYALGLAIYNSSSKIRNALTIDRHEEGISAQKESFLFRWSMAACLHDIAYPLEISLKTFNNYSGILHGIKDDMTSNFITIHEAIYTDINYLSILKPSDQIQIKRRDTALGLIAEHLTREKGNWSSPITYETLLDLMVINLKESLKIGRIDHGIFSALVMLNRIHKLYEQSEDWNIRDFYFEVVDAATAIFLHNTYRRSLKNIFGNGQFRYDYPSSLGFLLYLCDTFCEWLRSQKEDAHKYRFSCEIDNNLSFKMPSDTIEKIQTAINLIDDRIRGDITITATH